MNIEIAFSKNIRFGIKLFYFSSFKVFFLIGITLPFFYFDIDFSDVSNRIYLTCGKKISYSKEFNLKEVEK